jgi:outer membrane protein OmpA-like peptidoglycan-associated protein
MRFSGLKVLLCGVLVLPVSACYSTVYDPWFDENSSLYEDMQVIDVTKQQPPLDTTSEKVDDNVYVAEKASYTGKNAQTADKAFVASPLDKVEGTVTVEKKPAAKKKVSFVSAYIPYLKDSYRLDSKDRKSLKETAEICKEHSCKLRIISYASKKNKNYETLSEKRALEIRKFLTKNGIAYGDIKVQAQKDTDAGNFAEVLIEY